MLVFSESLMKCRQIKNAGKGLENIFSHFLLESVEHADTYRAR